MPLKACPVCLYTKCQKAFVQHAENFLKCAQCGLYYSENPLPPEVWHKNLQADYLAQQEDGHFVRLENEFDQWRIFSMNQIINFLNKIVGRKAKLLDVGCATGALFRGFSESTEWEFYGVEPSEAGYEYARTVTKNRSNVHLYNGYIKEAAYPDNFFNVITLLGVIFYFENLNMVFEEIKRVIKKDGWLFIEIPSLLFLFLRHRGLLSNIFFGKNSPLPHHRYYFSHQSIERLIKRHGFIIQKTVILPTSVQNYGIQRFLSILFWQFSKFIYMISFGKINLGPRTLYIARRIN